MASQYIETITDPLIELLAIKLFEHDSSEGYAPLTVNLGWTTIPNEDRDIYRRQARGESPIGVEPRPRRR
jgi:hypothetical protein